MTDFVDVMNIADNGQATHRVEFFNERTDTAERFDVIYPTDKQAVQAAIRGHEPASTFYHGILVMRYVKLDNGRRNAPNIQERIKGNGVANHRPTNHNNMTSEELIGLLKKHPNEMVWTTNKKNGRRMLYSASGVQMTGMGLVIYSDN